MPADVHDYLFDKKLLEESLFGGVHGGNVLDDEHMGSMLETLEAFPPSDKAAVCFFFHEHVCAILKVKKYDDGDDDNNNNNNTPPNKQTNKQTLRSPHACMCHCHRVPS